MRARFHAEPAHPPGRSRSVWVIIAVTAALGAVIAVSVGIFLPADDDGDDPGGTGDRASGESAAAEGVCDLVPADLVDVAVPGATGYQVPAVDGSACRWSVLLEDTPGRRINRQLVVSATFAADPAADIERVRQGFGGLTSDPETRAGIDRGEGNFGSDLGIDLGDGGSGLVLDSAGREGASMVWLAFARPEVVVDLRLLGWSKEGEETYPMGVPIADLQPIMETIGAAVEERLPTMDSALTEVTQSTTEHPIESLPNDGCDLLTDEIVGEHVSTSAETTGFDEIDYPNCGAGGELDPAARSDGSTYRRIGVFVRTAEDVDQATTWHAEQVDRSYRQAHDEVSRAGEVAGLADRADEAFALVGTSTERSLQVPSGEATVVARLGDAVVTVSLTGSRPGPDGQEPIPPEDLDAEAIELTKKVLEQL